MKSVMATSMHESAESCWSPGSRAYLANVKLPNPQTARPSLLGCREADHTRVQPKCVASLPVTAEQQRISLHFQMALDQYNNSKNS